MMQRKAIFIGTSWEEEKTGMGSNSIFGGSYIHQKGVEVVQVQKAFNNKQCKKKTGLIAMFCIHSQKANRLDCRSKIRYC